MNTTDFEFLPPPEAPVFEPTVEEFKDPLAYIAKIRPIAEQTGICKIKPPPEWQPPFAVDVDNFRFTPRMQRLNELEATTRVKLNFLDQIAKFWELQGSSLKIPNVERKALDLFTLYRVVLEEGGFDLVSRDRRWSRIATRMGFPPGRGVGSLLRQHYERILYPYHVFQEGTSIGDISARPDSDETAEHDKESVPPMRPASESPTDARRSSKRRKDGTNGIDIDYSTNNELKKLQFYGAGPKMPGFPAPGQVEMDEESKTFLKDNHIECFKDVKLGHGAKDLKMGFGAKLTSSFLKETKTVEELEAVKLGVLLKRKDKPKGKTPIDQIVCAICCRGDEEASMLLCDGCDDSYHTFCLIPPLPEIPKGDWRCPCCVAKEVNKPQEAFGFEQAQREYTLQEFGLKADEFKTSYFNMPVHRVPYSLVEKEFWRIVNAVDEDVTVEYGADLHTIEHGSGFPNVKTKNLLPGDEDYVNSGWNLNNLPVLEGSVLRHINADISGMKIPWTYVGMCFATFCWHNEDHWSYSINYLHWGEPKTWYGVPGGRAESFEEAMRSVAPELFSAQPDLLHQLVTIMNPNLLISHGVPICRTNQQAGEFVVTFPRSYHAGFNQGYNFAEAVNFAPADWLPIGRVCVSHYGVLHRFCVFSHDELVCKMASDPDKLDISIAASTYQDMLKMVEAEKDMRKSLLEWGVSQASREVFELLPDDERQCIICKTTCFLSAVTCSCNENKIVCIPHKDKLCTCPPEKHCLLYRYTLDELPSMLYRLKSRAESFDMWSSKAENALNTTRSIKISLSALRDLTTEAEERRFPITDLRRNLDAATEEGERCAALAQRLLANRTRTRARQSGEGRNLSKLSLEDLRLFYFQLSTLPCEIKEVSLVQAVLDSAVNFQTEVREILNSDEQVDSKKLEKCLEAGGSLDIDMPEIPLLNQKLQRSRWLEEVQISLAAPVSLDLLRGLLRRGAVVPPHAAVERVLAELQDLLAFGEEKEEKAKLCLSAKPKHPLAVLESVVRDAGNISVHLPSVLQLAEVTQKGKDWLQKVHSIQNEAHNPYMNVLENLIAKARHLPVRLDQLTHIETQVDAARSWRDKTARTFLKKNSCYTLLEVLSPRRDIGATPSSKYKRKKRESDEGFGDDSLHGSSDEEPKAPATVVANFKEAERKELEAMIAHQVKNVQKYSEERPESRFCVCHKPFTSTMVQCELCRDWFHVSCVPLPKSRRGVDGRFLCPLCVRSRRPRLETILSLLMSLQKLPVRLPEGEALQCLTERGMSWQDRAKQVLKGEEVIFALATLSSLHQQRSDGEKPEPSDGQKTKREPDEQIPEADEEAAGAVALSQPLRTESFHLASAELEEDGSSANCSSEHAYSSASKTPSATPRKHSRKSPLVARQVEPPPPVQLSESTQVQLEELQREGDLLEMTLDESSEIWKVLWASRRASADPFALGFSDTEDNLPAKEEKKKPKKQKVLDPKAHIKSKVPGVKGKKEDRPKKKKKLHLFPDAAKRFRGDAPFRKEAKDGSVKVRPKFFDRPKKFRKSSGGKERREEPDDLCSAASCLRPIGEAVNWVQCDGGCEQWFHLLCVGLDVTQVSETEDYICPNCRQGAEAASVLANLAKGPPQ